MGDEIAGILDLPTGEALEVEGCVVRVAAPSVALILSKGVPFGIMIDQQRFINQRHFTTI